jgi:hypothetical protein
MPLEPLVFDAPAWVIEGRRGATYHVVLPGITVGNNEYLPFGDAMLRLAGFH